MSDDVIFVNGVLQWVFFLPMRHIKLAHTLTVSIQCSISLWKTETLYEAAGANIPLSDVPVLAQAGPMLHL